MTYKNNDDDAAFFDDEEEEECRVCRGPAEDGYVTSHFRMKKKKLRSLRFLTCFDRIARIVTFYIAPYIVVHCLNHAFVLEVLL
jgi:hypothetical protein